MIKKKEKSKKEIIDVVVTEVLDARNFYIQILGEEHDQLEKLMAAIESKENTKPSTEISPKAGQLVIAQFADGKWYR